VPSYGSKFSKRTFTKPHLVALYCLKPKLGVTFLDRLLHRLLYFRADNMDWVTLLINVAASLLGGSVSGTLISYYLDRRRIGIQKRTNKAKLSAQICYNFKNIKQLFNIGQLSLDIQLIDQLLDDFTPEQVEDIYAKIDKLKKNFEHVRQQFEQCHAQNMEIADSESSLRSYLLELYEVFAPPLTGQQIGIFKNPIIPRGKGRCGHWGLATPEEYYQELRKYNARYINPFDKPGVWGKYKIVINPYGEYYFVRKDIKIEQFAGIVKRFIENGGIWVHAGGYPFYKAVIEGQKEPETTHSLIAEELKLEIEGTDGRTVTTEEKPEGVRYLGRVNWRCESGIRSLQNADNVYATAKSNKGDMNVLASKIIGNGLFLHYGGMHSKIKIEEVSTAIKTLCRLIKSISLETR
jgi:hypothetical protein